MGLTYAKSGVDIDEKSAAIAALVKELRFARRGFGAPVDIGGHFSGLLDFGRHYLSLCTDGVGTKLLVAEALDRWDTVGIDCVAMNSNDMICVGAEPLAFVDYIAVDRPRPGTVRAVGRGLSRGAQLANLSIIGGETAVLPEMVRGLDLSGTCLGFVRKGDQVTGSAVRPGDVVIGIESSGIHSNGLTLARRVFKDAQISLLDNLPGFDRSVGEELLSPTIIYVRPVMELLRKVRLHGLANITGGGLRNLLRLRIGVQVRIEEPLTPQPIFAAMQKLGRISDREMHQTFNMGMGFALVAPKASAGPAIDILARRGLRAQLVGRIAKGSGVVHAPKKLAYTRY
ncbi:MAG: phosphoribosylformylglycinamidine cyclo-ligase [Euryarchaeota archaeon]|nr:phosphoribosylformylglycinamidine cyclo-ligase [Euryarchaeota archaeon]